MLGALNPEHLEQDTPVQSVLFYTVSSLKMSFEQIDFYMPNKIPNPVYNINPDVSFNSENTVFSLTI